MYLTSLMMQVVINQLYGIKNFIKDGKALVWNNQWLGRAEA